MIQNEEDILQHIASRNPDRFRLIFRAFERQIKNYVSRVISTREDAEEVVQNTFLNAFRHLDDYKPERASLLTWLMRIATNEIRMYFRKKQPSLVSLDEEEEPLLLVSDDEADQILMETTENRIAHLQRAIRLLSADEQLLLQLYYTEQRSLRDIAFIIDTNKPLAENDTHRMENQLAQRLHRIRKKLSLIIIKMEKDEKQ
ncbi:MAG: sigma-70 family RNA polymerase sigma factor [Prevotella sp.]|nr:sigma-70 family RNA polymerase sigma factor [Prevotella sp.]